MGTFTRGPGVLSFCIERTWFKLAVTRSNWFLLVVVHGKDSMRNSVACHVTFNLDVDKSGCVIQIKWTKAPSDNCQPML